MANDEHVALLKKDVDAWNAWRKENPNIYPDLSEADLSDAILIEADLFKANLSEADLSDAILIEANLFGANLSGANVRSAFMMTADLVGADLSRANLSGANLGGANLITAILSDANLSGANLSGANLGGANLSGANLSGGTLTQAILVGANFSGATLTGCGVYGVSAWGLKLDEATKQENLVITNYDEPTVTVDNIEVAQFVYSHASQREDPRCHRHHRKEGCAPAGPLH